MFPCKNLFKIVSVSRRMDWLDTLEAHPHVPVYVKDAIYGQLFPDLFSLDASIDAGEFKLWDHIDNSSGEDHVYVNSTCDTFSFHHDGNTDWWTVELTPFTRLDLPEGYLKYVTQRRKGKQVEISVPWNREGTDIIYDENKPVIISATTPKSPRICMRRIMVHSLQQNNGVWVDLEKQTGTPYHALARYVAMEGEDDATLMAFGIVRDGERKMHSLDDFKECGDCFVSGNLSVELGTEWRSTIDGMQEQRSAFWHHTGKGRASFPRTVSLRTLVNAIMK
jgi:hypothetical protein